MLTTWRTFEPRKFATAVENLANEKFPTSWL
jgi:hypothetical protein